MGAVSAWLWILVIAVMVAAPFVGAYCLGRAREKGELDELQAAVRETERAVGEVFLPIAERMSAALVKWNKYAPDARVALWLISFVPRRVKRWLAAYAWRRA